ncbi:hypothetical protein KRR55_16580 [Paeniglutamicibacter sp. ABSL32-1]|uniref:hypothetical protein n=1 Tax=Paeniglutamicibacter quisquiliarum TaxID=2849498 RepID=UPI001C2DA59D|nr:hypothetical protein [Paeniglutamicibacter quisquiliarum]MBV1780733.1 hypothetical protein [Paeniglutamicibacter quisquiliarum]
MVEKALENLGQIPQKWLADTGHSLKANLEQPRELEAEHVTEFFIATGRMKHAAPSSPSPTYRIMPVS